MSQSKDLFDDSTMSFGDHLEALRYHLWRALIGLGICVITSLFYGNNIIAIVRGPIDTALQDFGIIAEDDVASVDSWDEFKGWINSLFGSEEESPKTTPVVEETEEEKARKQKTGVIEVDVYPSDLANILHRAKPDFYPNVEKPDDEDAIKLRLKSPAFAQFQKTSDAANRPVTLNVEEAFMTYLKVSFVAGFVVASPWVFYQLWLFVASGLYPHERKYVYVYLPMSIFLFIGGAVFCFYAVFPFVLKFLLSFNAWLEINPQIRLSEWISFAITLPMMFGISFQLPMVMLFLERISVFDATVYREKRRMAILVIATLSMLLTPADPTSMLLMMFPLVLLYELGIWMCGFSPAKSPFEGGGQRDFG